MTGRILSGALVAGLLAGCLSALLQLALLVPLIVEAEAFEAAAHHHADGQGHADGHDHAPPGAGGLGRPLGTLATTLVAFAGFGLVLGAAMSGAVRLGGAAPPSARTGALWGLAGFAAVHLAPAAGLPPELPGAAAADLAARQAWWALCAGSTALGLGGLAFGRTALALAAGAGLVALPHLLGAPAAPSQGGLVPPGLAAEFVGRSLGVACLAWASLGALTGALAERRPAVRRAPAP